MYPANHNQIIAGHFTLMPSKVAEALLVKVEQLAITSYLKAFNFLIIQH